VSFVAAVLTEIYRCNVCSCPEILRRNGRGQEWRYTEWFAFNDTSLVAEMGTTIARELYDHRLDMGNDMDFPGAGSDLINVADEPAHAEVAKELAAMVRAGWTAARPAQ
jgi:hypothetical protein